MKFHLFSSVILLSLLTSCNNQDASEETKTPTPQTQEEAPLTPEQATPAHTSSDSLQFYITNNKPLPCEYMGTLETGAPNCPLQQHEVLQETDTYLIVRSMNMNPALDALPYYLCSFSKETGLLLSFIPIGQEAEGMEPNTLRWQSKKEFSMISYTYDFIEDEESGAYMQGDVLDSTVTDYRISAEGTINQQDIELNL